ncbi:MAG TPA: hypothetical protein VFA41_15290 [Ktedonobacteraceae bacterium]|nr:hypothetical protein [Ktedonobacteraceae bacterium]
MYKRRIILGLISFATLTASVLMAFAVLSGGNNARASNAGAISKVTDFYLSGGQEPWGVTFDSQGNVWVAVPGCDPSPTCSTSTPPGKIEEFNPTASSWIASYQLPSGYAQPLFLAFDGSGNLWFPMPMSNSIGMFSPQNHTFQQWAVPTAGSGPWDVAIDHNGKVWFTEHYTNKIGYLDPSTHTVHEFTTPAANSQPYGIVVDGSNNVWFTENNSAVAQIGEYTNGTIKEYKIRSNPPSGLTPHLITVDTNGNIWWSEGWTATIGRLIVSQAVPGTTNGVTEYTYTPPCSSCGTHTSGIAVDHSGNVWFDDSLQSVFGSFPLGGSGSFAFYNTPTSNSHPHDGLNVDGQNRIWFTEEFANKLAEAIQSGVTPSPTAGKSPTPGMTPSPSPSPSPTMSPTPSPTPGTTLGQDTFQRANQTYWGKASDGQTWGGEAATNSSFSITNNAGQVNSNGNSYNAVLGPVATNAQVLFSGSISSFNNTNFGAVLRWKDTNNWYKAYIDGTNLVIQKKVNGTTTTLITVPFKATAGTSYTLRFSVVGTTLSAKVWQTGTSEPANWMATVNDSSLSSGYCGLRMLAQNGAVVRFTSFLATAQ